MLNESSVVAERIRVLVSMEAYDDPTGAFTCWSELGLTGVYTVSTDV